MSGFGARDRVEYPTDPLAFKGFMPSYRKKGDPLPRKRRKDPVLWSEQVRAHNYLTEHTGHVLQKPQIPHGNLKYPMVIINAMNTDY